MESEVTAGKKCIQNEHPKDRRVEIVQQAEGTRVFSLEKMKKETS